MGIDFDSIVYAGGGKTIAATTTASSGTTVPQTAAGKNAKHVRVTSSAEAYIALGTTSSVAATTTDLMLNVSDAVILNITGFSHFSVMAQSAARVNIAPLEGG